MLCLQGIMAVEKKSAKNKNDVKFDRLSQNIDRKMKEIDNTTKLLETNINQLKRLVENKRIKTEEYIQTIKDKTFVRIDDIIKQMYTRQVKPNDVKYTNGTDVEYHILAMTQERLGQSKIEMQGKMAKEKYRLEREVENMKRNEAKERTRYKNEIHKLKDEIKTISSQIENMRKKKVRKKLELDEIQKKMAIEKKNLQREIKTLKETEDNIQALIQYQAELKRKVESEKRELKLYETQVKNNIENLKNTLHINEDQNVKIRNIEIMQIEFAETKEQYEKNIKIIQQFEAEKQLQIESEIQRLKEREVQAKMNLMETMQALQSTAQEKNEAIKQHKAAIKSETETNILKTKSKNVADEENYENFKIGLQKKEAEKNLMGQISGLRGQQGQYDKKQEDENKRIEESKILAKSNTYVKIKLPNKIAKLKEMLTQQTEDKNNATVISFPERITKLRRKFKNSSTEKII